MSLPHFLLVLAGLCGVVALMVGTVYAIALVACGHFDDVLVRNVYGDEINVVNARSVWRCSRCGRVRYKQHLAPEEATTTRKVERL
jgi:hypothetical protein